MLGQIRDLQVKLKIGIALQEIDAGKDRGQLVAERKEALIVGLAHDLADLVQTDVKGQDLDPHFGIGHGLAEEISGLYLSRHPLTGQVVAPVWREAHAELGQGVAFDLHGLDGLGGAHAAHDLKGPHVDFAGQLEVDRGDAEGVGQTLFLENLVALAVAYLKHKGLIGHGPQGGASKRQRPQMHGLARLVDRLVGGQEDFLLSHDLHHPAQGLHFALGRLDGHDHLALTHQVGRGLQVDLGRALFVGASLSQGHRRVFELQLNDHVHVGSGLSACGIAGHDPQKAARSFIEAGRGQDLGLQFFGGRVDRAGTEKRVIFPFDPIIH